MKIEPKKQRKMKEHQIAHEQLSTSCQDMLPLPNENSMSYFGDGWPRNSQKCISVVRRDNFSWNIIHRSKPIMLSDTNIHQWHIMQIFTAPISQLS
jgi:hypothetical protein